MILIALRPKVLKSQTGHLSRVVEVEAGEHTPTLTHCCVTRAQKMSMSCPPSWLIGCCGKSYPESGCQETQPESSESSLCFKMRLNQGSTSQLISKV